MMSARAVMARYTHCVIQNGLTPRKTSLKVPPPHAVASPTMKAPKRSKFFLLARRIPLMAKANVPMRSMMEVMENVSIPCLLVVKCLLWFRGEACTAAGPLPPFRPTAFHKQGRLIIRIIPCTSHCFTVSVSQKTKESSLWLGET